MYKEYMQGRRIRRDGADGDTEYWDKTKAFLRAVEYKPKALSYMVC